MDLILKNLLIATLALASASCAMLDSLERELTEPSTIR
jgi:hypothetical protein